MSKTRLDWTQESGQAARTGLVALRRDFHRHPELSFQERRTARDHRRAAARARSSRCGRARRHRRGRRAARRPAGPHHRLARRHRRAAAHRDPRGAVHLRHAGRHARLRARRPHRDRHHAWPRSWPRGAREMPGTAVFLFQPAEEVLGGAEPDDRGGRARQSAGGGDLRPAPHDAARGRARSQVRPGPVDGLGRRLHGRGARAAAATARMPHLSIDPDHRRRQHPARHAEPRLARGARPGDRGAHGGADRRRHEGQHHPGPRGDARHASARSSRRCATSSSSGSAPSPPTSRAPTAPRRALRFEGEGSCPAVVNHAQETDVRARVRGGRGGRRAR